MADTARRKAPLWLETIVLLVVAVALALVDGAGRIREVNARWLAVTGHALEDSRRMSLGHLADDQASPR